MNIHYFEDADLRILATLAIDLYIDHLDWKVVRYSNVRENYWSIDVRFAVGQEELETNYDSLHIDCGRDNKPETYQMSWGAMRDGKFKQQPICSPLLVVHQFEELCKKSATQMN